jgi:hypothetical protein
LSVDDINKSPSVLITPSQSEEKISPRHVIILKILFEDYIGLLGPIRLPGDVIFGHGDDELIIDFALHRIVLLWPALVVDIATKNDMLFEGSVGPGLMGKFLYLPIAFCRMSEVPLDDCGRLTLPRDLREQYGDRYRIVKAHDSMKLIPVADDPLLALRDEFEEVDKSADTLRTVARGEARDEACE